MSRFYRCVNLTIRLPIWPIGVVNAQLTTELCGALAPGMPAHALRICDLPIRNTAASYAAHAAQHYVLLYTLAPVVDPALSAREKVIWLATEARKYIPDSSKTADIFDFVLGDFLRFCPEVNALGCDDREVTRDRLGERYQRQAGGNGFKYYDWYDSAVNFGTGVMALLYGQGDLKRTIQIGTLSGWDSDNGTATMGGLLGLMNGYDWVVGQFPGRTLSDRYNIRRTRSFDLPDYLPHDPTAEDSFAMIAERMRPLVVESLGLVGGRVEGGIYLLPELPAADHVDVTPTRKLYESSVNNRVRLEGGWVKAITSSPAPVDEMPGPGNFADGAEQDFSGREPPAPSDEFWGRGGDVEFTVSYSHAVPLKTLRFIEGGAHSNGVGYFQKVTPQIMVDGTWRDLPAGAKASDSITSAPYQIIDWTLPEALSVAGIRLRGSTVGGFASIIELDALSDVAGKLYDGGR